MPHLSYAYPRKGQTQMNTPIPPQPEPARERDDFPPPTEYFDRITPPEGQPAVAAANTAAVYYDSNGGVVLPEGT